MVVMRKRRCRVLVLVMVVMAVHLGLQMEVMMLRCLRLVLDLMLRNLRLDGGRTLRHLRIACRDASRGSSLATRNGLGIAHCLAARMCTVQWRLGRWWSSSDSGWRRLRGITT